MKVSVVDVFLFVCLLTRCLQKVCKLLSHGKKKLFQISLLSLDLPLTFEKYQCLEFLLKIDLRLYVAKHASVYYLRCFSAKWNNVLVQQLCAQRISTSSLQTPTNLWRSAYPIPTKRDLSVGHYIQIQVCAGKSIYLRDSCLRENCLRGKRTQLLFLSVFVM